MTAGLKLTEEQLQRSLVTWFSLRYPASARWLHHSPNGGMRSKATAGKLKAAGTKAGFPDLVLYERRGAFVGLVIENKTDTGRATTEQLDWIAQLTACGFDCYVCRGYTEAELRIKQYMAQPTFGPITTGAR